MQKWQSQEEDSRCAVDKVSQYVPIFNSQLNAAHTHIVAQAQSAIQRML